jgi:hypothetical protein
MPARQSVPLRPLPPRSYRRISRTVVPLRTALWGSPPSLPRPDPAPVEPNTTSLPVCRSFADHPNDAEGRGRVVSDNEQREARGADRRKHQRATGSPQAGRTRHNGEQGLTDWWPDDRSHAADRVRAAHHSVGGRAEARWSVGWCSAMTRAQGMPTEKLPRLAQSGHVGRHIVCYRDTRKRTLEPA